MSSANQDKNSQVMAGYSFEPEKYEQELLGIFTRVPALLAKLGSDNKPTSLKSRQRKLQEYLRDFPRDGNGLFSRDQLISGYNYLVKSGKLIPEPGMLELFRLKPVRTNSGVTPVTVLTKPFPCPGNCIFCPNDIRMPKSYIASEPGAQRAGRNAFDPYLQTYNRLLAYTNIGHQVNKVELIVLGGTWSFYPEPYRIWFIKRCFDALNDFGLRDDRPVKQGIDFDDKQGEAKEPTSYNQELAKQEKAPIEQANWEELITAQDKNMTATCRNVGLVLETRPDYVTEAEVICLRKLGATKVQIGVQTLNNEILKLNQRGTTVSQIANAFKLLRLAGFKIHAHIMPNLFGATPESDLKDYQTLWGPKFCPDELKIYPTSIIKGTILFKYFQEGKYQPYNFQELHELLTQELLLTPRFCRLNRIVRDIPSQEISAGNKITNFRQLLEQELIANGTPCQCIRCREIGNKEVSWPDLELEQINYKTAVGTDHFISYKTKNNDKITGFLRLTLPDKNLSTKHFITELQDSALIREVHVYGRVTKLGQTDNEHTQHMGIGRALVANAEKQAQKKGFKKIAVISAIGTRGYYQKLGYKLDALYMSKEL